MESIIGARDAGKKLKDFARAIFPHVSSKKAFSGALKQGLILVNEKQVDGGQSLKQGDTVKCLQHAAPKTLVSSSASRQKQLKSTSLVGAEPLEICYSDSSCAVVWKPSGTAFDITLLEDKLADYKIFSPVYSIQRATSALLLLRKRGSSCLCQWGPSVKLRIRCRAIVKGCPVNSNQPFLITAASFQEGCSFSDVEVLTREVSRSNAEDTMTTLDVWPVWATQPLSAGIHPYLYLYFK